MSLKPATTLTDKFPVENTEEYNEDLIKNLLVYCTFFIYCNINNCINHITMKCFNWNNTIINNTMFDIYTRASYVCGCQLCVSTTIQYDKVKFNLWKGVIKTKYVFLMIGLQCYGESKGWVLKWSGVINCGLGCVGRKQN